MLDSRKILLSIFLLLCSYFLFVLLLQKSIAGRNIIHIVHNIINSNLTSVFDHTGLYAQALDGKPYSVRGEIAFTLQGAPPATNYDTKFTFVNSKKLMDNIKKNNLGGKVTLKMDVGDYRFSFWHFLLLPCSLLLSLWLASIILYPFQWTKFGLTFLLLGLVLSFEFFCTLVYMRSHAVLLEPFEASTILKKLANLIYSVQAIEFIYIKLVLIWLIVNTKELANLFLKKR